jgi:hypothetical protein
MKGRFHGQTKSTKTTGNKTLVEMGFAVLKGKHFTEPPKSQGVLSEPSIQTEPLIQADPMPLSEPISQPDPSRKKHEEKAEDYGYFDHRTNFKMGVTPEMYEFAEKVNEKIAAYPGYPIDGFDSSGLLSDESTLRHITSLGRNVLLTFYIDHKGLVYAYWKGVRW